MKQFEERCKKPREKFINDKKFKYCAQISFKNEMTVKIFNSQIDFKSVQL